VLGAQCNFHLFQSTKDVEAQQFLEQDVFTYVSGADTTEKVIPMA